MKAVLCLDGWSIAWVVVIIYMLLCGSIELTGRRGKSFAGCSGSSRRTRKS